MKLIIGNKNYSSWSFRVWLTLKVHGIAFEEDLRTFDVENDYADFFEFAPHGKVPVLIDGKLTVWETLAILEYLAEKAPEANLWPADPAVRAKARSICNEMHAGFLALRAACPMNMRRRIEPVPIDGAVKKDVARIEQIWADCLEAHGGPFLFGSTFTIADGMYAPIVNRFAIYELSDHPATRAYSDTLTNLPAWREWAEASAKESWVVDIDEVYA
ncbi:MAG: glutathione S-transferase family protein [Pseudomonadota bacterium]